MKITTIILCTLFYLPTYAADKQSIYWAYTSEYATADSGMKIAPHQSPYTAVLDKCFKFELTAFNVVYEDLGRKWQQSVICYDDENFNLSQALKVKMEDCVDQRARSIYRQAKCMQEKIVMTHNSLNPAPPAE